MNVLFKTVMMTFCLCMVAFTGKTWAQTYDSIAVVVIQTLITNNGLIANPDDPSSWDFATWDDGNPKQLVELDFYSSDHVELTGVASFVGLTFLEYLDCDNNDLTQLDVSGLANLELLYCSENNLTQLNVFGLINLIELSCYENKLTQLDLSSLIHLDDLDCEENSLTQLDITNCTDLMFLKCSNNSLTELDITNCADLMVLNCSNNGLTELDVSNCTNLMNLFCNENQLTELNISDLVNLMILGCSYNNLTELDVSGLNLLSSLDCQSNNLTLLNVFNANLQYLNCENNSLTNLVLIDLNLLSDFVGDNQNVSLILYSNGAGAYTLPIELNNPIFNGSSINYNDGKLISPNNMVSSTVFETETGIGGYKLRGTMYFTYSDVSTTNISQTENLRIYPNPAKDVLNIQSPCQVVQISFYDLSGREIKTIYNPQSSVLLNRLANGIYILKIKTETSENMYKIIKQ